jgi:hypothetical protein
MLFPYDDAFTFMITNLGIRFGYPKV